MLKIKYLYWILIYTIVYLLFILFLYLLKNIIIITFDYSNIFTLIFVKKKINLLHKQYNI